MFNMSQIQLENDHWMKNINTDNEKDNKTSFYIFCFRNGSITVKRVNSQNKSVLSVLNCQYMPFRD